MNEMHRITRAALAAGAAVAILAATGCGSKSSTSTPRADSMSAEIVEGQRVFRFDTFGDEQF